MSSEDSSSVRSRDIIRQFNKYIFNPIILALVRRGKGPFSAVRHKGRCSDREYTTPVLATYIGNDIIVPLSYGEHVDWLRNVQARGSCEIHWKREVMVAVDPRIIDAETALLMLPDDRRALFQRFDVDKFLLLRRQIN
ncbi:MAG: nitroreductase [Anaerolineales bacterium]|nr:nitroreductase [Anaerolineales bacterium]